MITFNEKKQQLKAAVSKNCENTEEIANHRPLFYSFAHVETNITIIIRSQ